MQIHNTTRIVPFTNAVVKIALSPLEGPQSPHGVNVETMACWDLYFEPPQIEADRQTTPWSRLMPREIKKGHPRIDSRFRTANVVVLLPHLHADTDWRVLRLRQSIDERDGQLGCRLGELCRQLDLGITASHISRLFHQATGIAIREYMKRKRLQTAAIKLQTTTLSIKEIAADLGYRSPTDFFRQFKKVFHVTPQAFRIAWHTDEGNNAAWRGKIVS